VALVPLPNLYRVVASHPLLHPIKSKMSKEKKQVQEEWKKEEAPAPLHFPLDERRVLKDNPWSLTRGQEVGI